MRVIQADIRIQYYNYAFLLSCLILLLKKKKTIRGVSTEKILYYLYEKKYINLLGCVGLANKVKFKYLKVHIVYQCKRTFILDLKKIFSLRNLNRHISTLDIVIILITIQIYTLGLVIPEVCCFGNFLFLVLIWAWIFDFNALCVSQF